jgi:hypothetical protein
MFLQINNKCLLYYISSVKKWKSKDKNVFSIDAGALMD